MNNRGGEYGTLEVKRRTPAEAMDEFDALPAEFRKLLREAPYNLALIQIPETATVDMFLEVFENIKKKSVLATYGQDHPAAR